MTVRRRVCAVTKVLHFSETGYIQRANAAATGQSKEKHTRTNMQRGRERESESVCDREGERERVRKRESARTCARTSESEETSGRLLAEQMHLVKIISVYSYYAMQQVSSCFVDSDQTFLYSL